MKKQSNSRARRGSPAQKRVVILGLPPVDSLDVIGPAEVFTVANRLYGREVAPYKLELISASADVQLPSATGIGLIAHKTLAQERLDGEPIDTLIVATGWDSATQPSPEALAWIRERSADVRRMCSICVAAFALAGAGLLDGRRATTHWGAARELAERYPKIKVDANPIWIKDGNLYTSAGISAGIDLALALVGEDLGGEIAMDIAKNLVLFLRRPGGQAQFSVTLQSQRASGSSLDELCVWISEHLHTELTVEILADRMSTSVRTLIRMFQRDLKTTPAKYVEDVRLEAACRAFEMGGRSMEEIARRCGYNSIDVLRKAFIRRLGVSPKEYAMRFARDDRTARAYG
ncbi:helix-turn-helix domain-containing protein [Pseudomonas sp. C1C7]|uniref:GlxA family transcriptional regulator n=1 Tax=Pseudomonas sp. C1C7 TaxID=2735272 RepID=UPI001586D8FF|nr:helix-turn-helix domain-containing protein [Pseudomonas sp. C1C7]NUT79294.1 helix-turn-helix domain-containing protein [Pseudomonas sp. C1C7]